MNRFFYRGSGALLPSLLLATALSGCMVGPNYTTPKTTLTPYHNLAAAAALKQQPAAPLDIWWEGFNDPMLASVVQRSLDQNLDLEAAFARVQQARAVASGTGAALLPTLDLDASSNYTHQSLNGATGTISQASPGFHRDGTEDAVGPSASWEIDLFGGLRRNVRAAGDETQAAEASQAATRVTVAADAADAYLQIRGYQARLAVAEKQIATDQQLVTLVQNRFAAGASSDREVAQAQALWQQAQASVPPLRYGLEVQLNRLDVLMGAQPGTYAQELSAVRDIPVVPAVPANAQPVDLLRRRPDVVAAERRLAASDERIGAAISDYYPKISLSGALGFDSLSANQFLSANAFAATGGGALHWRIFDFGKVDAEVTQARGANAEALADYRQSVLRATEDVEDSLAAFTQTQAHVLQLQAEVQSLTKARNYALQDYQAGSITLTDVLNADSQLLTAQDELDANRADTARAAVGVYRALGGGWNPSSGA
jgi:NodT family efflux transporter outer membrane factor (OMF) lipoprotein